MPRGKASEKIKTSHLIREYLLANNDATSSEIYKYISDKLQEKGYKPPSRHSFDTTMYILRQLNLIHSDKGEGAFSISRHTLIRENAYSPAWDSPSKAYETLINVRRRRS